MPPELTDEEDMEVGSSTTSATDATVDAAASAANTDTANSSSATDETEVDTLSVVRDVVEQREEVSAEAASSAEGEEVAGDGTGGQTPKAGADPDDYSDVPFNKHPRFQALVAEKNAYRSDSTEYRKITSFLDDNGLSTAEAADGIQIMSLMKLDPAEAWKALKPRIQNLLIAAGEVLPDDLAKQVEAKVLTREGALEISRARASEATLKARQKFNEDRGQRRQQQEAGASLTTAAATWENDRQLKDPNFAAKLPRIQEKLAFLHNVKRERPADAAGVTAQLKAVYAEVNKEFKAPAVAAAAPANGARPALARKPAITPIRGGQVASSAAAPSNKARSTLDIVRAGRERASA